MSDYIIKDFKHVTESQCLPLAKACQEAGKPWHSHVLPPGCLFSPFEKYAVVFEDDVLHQIYLADTDSFPMVDRDFVQMLHGDDILDPNAGSAATGTTITSPLLEFTRKVTSEGGKWHHHMHFPECSWNPSPGKWTISIEHDGKVHLENYPEEPVDTLREFELLFFSTQEPIEFKEK